jgi:acyl transferase domain-containing protein/acyl carrier protein
VLLEIGPGQSLSSLVLQHPAAPRETAVLSSLRHSYEMQPDPAYLLDTLGKLWLLGAGVDWVAFHAGERRRRVLLPAYPFERRRYWIDTVDAAAAVRRPEVGGGESCWLYVPSWKRSAPLPAPPAGDGRSWLVFADRTGLGAALAERLRGAGRQVATVEAGETAARLDEASFRLDPRSEEGYGTLLADLGALPDRIVHLWSVAPAEGRGEAAFEKTQELGLRSVLALVRALAARGAAAPLRLFVVGSHLYEVSGDEELRPDSATLLAACAAVPREIPGALCRALDVTLPAPGAGRERLVGQLALELQGGAVEPLAAWRGAHRWVPALAVVAPGPAAERPARLRERGVYLVVHGLEGLGFTFADYLARTARARLVLLEPSGFPEPGVWSDWLASDPGEGRISRAIRRARELEARGAEILVSPEGAPGRAGMSRLLSRARKRFGGLDGVVYPVDPDAAPAAGEPASAGNGYVPGHARALRALDAALRDGALDFALLVSPSAGRAATDTAASLFFDAFAASRAGRWTSVTWELQSGESRPGEDALQRLFSLAAGPQVIVSPRPLDDGWHKLRAEPREEPAVRTDAAGLYPRPSLRVEYVPPESDAEKAVAGIWSDLLGVAHVGAHDSFLDLGGDSLLASRMMTRLREVCGVELPIRLVFEARTVTELARAVDEAQRELADKELLDLLEKIQGLSEADVDLEIIKRRERLDEETRA